MTAQVKIKIEGLTKEFGSPAASTRALDVFSLTVNEGEFVCIVGPSGCGKTTALRIIADLEEPSSGSIEVKRSSMDGRPLSSMVFQEHSLFPWMTVSENVAYGLEMQGMSKRERMERIDPFLETIGLKRFANHYPNQLSGGMRQRVSLARAFVMDPEILLMDEPFAALDPQNRLLMQEELLRIWESNRKTVIFITHSIDEALVLGDRAVVMTASPGRIKQIVPIDFARPRSVAELKADPTFGQLELRIWRILEQEVLTARNQALQ
jgi:NitT/TauT family transport system ATP-binding protein